MKRTWAYVASFVPFTTAMSSSAMGAGLPGEDASRAAKRSKNAPEDEESGRSGPGADDAEAGSGTIGLQTPSHGDAGATGRYGDDAASDYGNSRPQPPKTHVIHNDGMFAPAGAPGGPAAYQGGGGVAGGGSILRSGQKSSTKSGDGPDIEAPPTTPPTSEGVPADGDPPDDTGYVEPHPEDADAMMILLGGMATGAGEGASSSGEVELDIVDFGPVTIGWGHATYSAQGGDVAHADTFFQVFGADLVFAYHDDEGSWNDQQSSTYVIAVDFEDDGASENPELAGVDWEELFDGLFGQGPFVRVNADEDEDDDIDVEGNVGVISVSGDVMNDSPPVEGDAGTIAFDGIGSAVAAWFQSEQAELHLNGEAEGFETLVSGDGSLVEIEDQFSSVSGAVTAVG